MSNQVVVNIKIHNRFYKIKVDADKESYVRKTAEDINKQLDEFHKKFNQCSCLFHYLFSGKG